MFTGIVTHIGRIIDRSGDQDVTFTIQSELDHAAIDLGASICHSGVCLTVTQKSDGCHQVMASAETLQRTTLANWTQGVEVNLETSLRLGDELGGHIVFGHVDGIGRLEAIDAAGSSFRLRVSVPNDLAHLVAFKGSISIDGISLTVNAVGDNSIELMIIPHTWANTTLRDRKVGDQVNLEADMLARYVARQLELGRV